MSERGGKLEGVEASRGLAAMLVVTVHVTSMLAQHNQYGVRVMGGLWLFGRAGVDFFFVLSGFIITFIHMRDFDQPDRFLPFWRKRVWRIYPIYWFATLGYQALLVLSPTADRAEQNPWHILASWLLLPEPAAPILGVGWSLRHELVFYAFFGLLLLRQKVGAVMLFAWGLGCAFNAATVMVTGKPAFTGMLGEVIFRIFNLEFFFGMAVAAFVRRPAWRPRAMLVAGILLFICNGLFEDFGSPLPAEWPPRHALYALGAAMALYGTATLDLGRRWAVPRWAVALGGASYSIYVVHVPVAVVAAELLRRGRAFVPIPIELAFVTTVGTAALAGLIVHRLIERPVMRYAARVNNRAIPVTS